MVARYYATPANIKWLLKPSHLHPLISWFAKAVGVIKFGFGCWKSN